MIGVVPNMAGRKAKKRVLKIGILLVGITCVAAGGVAWFVNGHLIIDAWLTSDQQGRYYFERGNYTAAAERFQDPLWKGIAYYRTKKFDTAVEQFARVETPDGYFNLGDAYAHSGQLDQALASYEEALRRRPEYVEARENRDLVRSLIQKKRSKEKEEEPPEGKEPTYKPDEIKLDEKGKKGKKGEIDQAELSAEQIQQLWMRRLQTTPSDFLRLKFAAQAEEPKTPRSQGGPHGGK